MPKSGESVGKGIEINIGTRMRFLYNGDITKAIPRDVWYGVDPTSPDIGPRWYMTAFDVGELDNFNFALDLMMPML